MQQIVVNSFGGCGSKHLTKAISRSTGNYSLEKIHLHERFPSNLKNKKIAKMVFLYADPYSVIKSFFWRQQVKSERHGFNSKSGKGIQTWPFQHCKNIDGVFGSLNPDWTIKEFLEHGEDLFKLEEFLDNWLEASVKFPIMFLRYDSMWDHIDEVSRFLDIDTTLALGQKFCRTSEKMPLNDKQQAEFERIYETLSEKVSSLEDVFYK
ncbi:hypothetical protein [Aliiglaciecola lipolytica]|uniref:Sulfotransferase domain-containing protein n=1 Tax=Aliiglaciecola lipolytica E3 TaxID=1127673 RepID=K6YPY0_9ALTE|nr:hypothetical protein [Aliiglaciecola lipolytica]GAC13360.1 hypothetical protein GLIP_0714 [Aliiglaciecola lipolytica E3]